MRLPRYPNYKISGVNWLPEIPSHWELSPLKRQVERNDSGVWGADPDGENDTTVLRSTEQTVDGNWRVEDPAQRKLSEQERASCLLAEGDLVVTKSSGSALHIGKTTLVSSEIAAMGCCYSNFMQRLRTKRSFMPRLAWYVMNSRFAREQFDLLSNSSTGLANLSGSIIGEVCVAIPPEKEQRAITSFLDRETAKIDALIAEQDRLLAHLAEKRQAVISHAVTKGLNPKASMKSSGVDWLGDVPANWEVKRFCDACESISTGPFGTTLGSDDYVCGGVPVINPSHIVDNEIAPDPDVSVSIDTAERLSNWTLRVDDIVVARRGELGRAAVISPDSDGWICGTGSLRVTPDRSRATAEYLHAILQSTYAREWLNQSSVGSTMPNLNEGILGRLPVALPPSIVEQEEITTKLAGLLSELSQAKRLALSCMGLLSERRSALIASAVTGQIDVRQVT